MLKLVKIKKEVIFTKDSVIENYRFCDIVLNTGSNYHLQSVENRRLSDKKHGHLFYEILCVLKGCCTHVLNGVERMMGENEFVLVLPYEVHCFKEQSRDLKLICLSVESDEFMLMANAFGLMTGDERFLGKDSYFQLKIGVEAPILLTSSMNFGTDLDCKGLLSVFVVSILKEAAGCYDVGHNIFRSRLEGIPSTEILKFGVPLLCKKMGYSRTHLTRLMKKYYDMTLQEYVEEKRMEYAYNSLVFSDTTVTVIAESCGFGSVSYFTQRFKKRHGLTPCAVRKNHFSCTV